MRHLSNIIAICALAMIATACTSPAERQAFIKAQVDSNAKWADSQKPLFRMTAVPGQVISGLGSIDVNMPNAAAPQIQQLHSEAAAITGQVINGVVTVGTVIAGGKAATGLAVAVGDAATRGYQYVQAPQANITTTNTKTNSDNSSVVTTANTKTNSDNTTTNTSTVTDNSNQGNAPAAPVPATP